MQDGEFELNAMLPVISESLLESLEMLRDGVKLFRERVIKGIEANREVCRNYSRKQPRQGNGIYRKVWV